MKVVHLVSCKDLGLAAEMEMLKGLNVVVMMVVKKAAEKVAMKDLKRAVKKDCSLAVP